MSDFPGYDRQTGFEAQRHPPLGDPVVAQAIVFQGLFRYWTGKINQGQDNILPKELRKNELILGQGPDGIVIKPNKDDFNYSHLPTVPVESPFVQETLKTHEPSVHSDFYFLYGALIWTNTHASRKVIFNEPLLPNIEKRIQKLEALIGSVKNLEDQIKYEKELAELKFHHGHIVDELKNDPPIDPGVEE